MSRAPDFDELVGGEALDAADRERLRRVHDLLVAAGPPPELPPSLEVVPEEPTSNVYPLFPGRRWAAAVAVAAAAAAAAFGLGYLVGDRGDQVEPARVVVMEPTGEVPAARASLALFDADDAGNWPMELTVQGLPPLPEGQQYELWLTRDGKLAESCGVFRVEDEGTTVVPLNAPYRLKGFDAWVITRAGSDTVLLTT